MRTWLVLLFFSASPALSEVCDDLWFTRNQIMDRAGYCFGSTLGKSVFDNSDCVGKTVALSPDASAKVARIQSFERDLGCRVDTRQSVLNLPDVWLRPWLLDLPVADQFESACMGWRRPPIALRAGHSNSSPVISQISPGDWISYAHWPEQGWIYVTVSTPGFETVKGGGWYLPSTPESTSDCDAWAG